jgi:hypothetical protein
MARYEQINTSPGFLAVNLEAQSFPGTCVHAELSAFDARFNDGNTSVPAFTFSVLALRLL